MILGLTILFGSTGVVLPLIGPGRARVGKRRRSQWTGGLKRQRAMAFVAVAAHHEDHHQRARQEEQKWEKRSEFHDSSVRLGLRAACAWTRAQA